MHETELAIWGEGLCEIELKQLAYESGLGEQVRFGGLIPSSQAREVLWACDVLVLPSHRESWGLVVNEALSAGKPAMAPYWVGAAGDILIDGVTGVTLGGNRPEDLAFGIEAVLKDDGHACLLGRRGQTLIDEGRWNIEGRWTPSHGSSHSGRAGC